VRAGPGRLRPEPGWIDALGEFLGACWIALPGYHFLILTWSG